jgi:hypothetical protein
MSWKFLAAALATSTCLSALAQTPDLIEEPICDVEDSDLESVLSLFSGQRRAVLEQAQRAWLEYREASCQLNSERPGYPDIAAAALEDCRAFMTRERDFELRLLTKANVRTILADE